MLTPVPNPSAIASAIRSRTSKHRLVGNHHVHVDTSSNFYPQPPAMTTEPPGPKVISHGESPSGMTVAEDTGQLLVT